uniref:F-box domain-containing protein n=1 Tax=Mycena chlorophos TaxID=658473 RepID=A0ABQ0M6Z7_MYCCL|nr:predicted protein [Mycena chlorophos]
MAGSSCALFVHLCTVADLRPQSLQSHWATQLAPDVIGEILLECIPFAAETRFSDRYAFSPGPRAMFPVSLTHVCREWRQAAINYKKLWSFLDVDQRTKDAARLEVYLARSGQYPLTIILTYPYADHEHTILGRLLRESSRWKTLFCDVYGLFDASPRSTGLTHAQWTALAFPELRNVVYFNSGHTSNESDEEEDDESDDDDEDEDEDDEWDEDDESSDTDDGTNDRDAGDGDLLPEDNAEDDQANDTSALVPAEPDQHFDKLLESLPGTVAAQLRRFYNYCIDEEFAEEMPIFLKRASRIRCDFISTDSFAWEFDYGPGTSDVLLLSLLHAEYAMFAIGDYQKAYNRSFLFRIELPSLRGLNLRVGRDGRNVFALRDDLPMPGYLTNLVVLRLCGRIVVTDDALTQIMDALSSLVDFTIELQESRDVNVAHLADLLTPQLPVIRVPRLEHLRFFLHHKPPNNTGVLPMLVARFTAPAGAPYARLRSFALYHTVLSHMDDMEEIRGIPGTLMMQLKELKAQHGWDIRVVEFNKFQGELWLEPLNGEFVLDI